MDHRKRIEQADVIALVAPIWNFRMPAILEGWIDKVLAPPWAFSFKKIFSYFIKFAIGSSANVLGAMTCTSIGSNKIKILLTSQQQKKSGLSTRSELRERAI